MTDAERLDAYLAAWNRHDGAAVARLFAAGGTYRDPDTGADVPRERVQGVVAALAAAFPDYTLDAVADSPACVQWVLRGHNHGPLGPGLDPTGREVALSGVDVIEWAPDGIASVRRYYDRVTRAEQAGLMALVQPVERGPATFGYSTRVASGNPRPPGVIALTWIQGKDAAERERIRAHARHNVRDFLEEPGFISIVTGFIGLRGFTVTAWEDEAAMRRALSGHHAVAMRELMGDDFVASVWTSVWRPTRINRLWVRCVQCSALQDDSDDHRACTECDAPLPTRPEFW